MEMNAEIIWKYFADLNSGQRIQLEKLGPIYKEWNAMINVISRKDIEALYLHHVLHSLGIVPYYPFREGSEILDLGTGGGFPGIPLAIFYPGVRFTLIDGTAKKLKVVRAVADHLQLRNINVKHTRAEELQGKYDMVVTRAVASADKILSWGRPLLKRKHAHGYPNGIIALKGGDIQNELSALGKNEYFETHLIYKVFPEEYFREKYVVYIQG